jgi:hypothetical protein
MGWSTFPGRRDEDMRAWMMAMVLGEVEDTDSSKA